MLGKVEVIFVKVVSLQNSVIFIVTSKTNSI